MERTERMTKKWIAFAMMLIASLLVNTLVGFRGIGQYAVVCVLQGYLIGAIMARVNWDGEET